MTRHFNKGYVCMYVCIETTYMYTGHVSTIYSLLTSFTGELGFVSSVRSEMTLICEAFTHFFSSFTRNLKTFRLF